MKKLILLSVLISASLFAKDEIVNRDDSNQIATVVKDIEVKQLLEETGEFRDCREKYPFDAKDGQTERNTKIKAAQDCFKQKLSNKTPEQLANLSDQLDLQSYNLVKSKNSKDIQKYLNDKMYHSMTGVDPNEQDQKKLMESMKFKNKKQIDQKVFITLWKTQIVKNSLFEISNFCLTKFRKRIPPSGNPTNFGEYWAGFKPDDLFDKTTGQPNLKDYIDSGTPVFGSLPNVDDKTKIYEDLFNSLKVGGQGGFDTKDLSNFFFACGKMIAPLCEKFKGDTSIVDIKDTKSAVDTPHESVGASACLAKSRLEEYKKALADTDKYEKAFNDLAADSKMDDLMQKITKGSPKLFGKGADDESLDNLTNYTSKDFIDGGLSTDSRTKDCFDHPEKPECEKQFLGDREELLKAEKSVETELTLKREVEMERVRKLKAANDSKLDEYLEQNGFYDILKKYKNGDFKDPEDLANAVGNEFEAKKVAVLQEMQKKLGDRQLKKDATAQEKTNAVSRVAQETKEERARLAQVVLFNNIITSNLNIERDLGNGKREKAGRNVNAFNKEAKALTSARVDANLFQNLKAQGDGSESQVGKNDQLGGITLIEEMLVKEKKP